MLIGLFFCTKSNAQLLPNRYIDEVFDFYTETKDVTFSIDVPRANNQFNTCSFLSGLALNANECDTTDVTLEMNILEPVGDNITMRPVVIICFGGGFVDGSKNEVSMRLLAEGFARRGFVAALIDYRLGMKITDPILSQRAVYRAIQDGRSAVRFFRADAAGTNTYKIDTEQIYIGGHSAGAFVALHNGYLDKESERPFPTIMATASGCSLGTQGTLDGQGENPGFSGKANAIFSLAGAVGDSTYLENASDVPVILFHDTGDQTVPFNADTPFKSLAAAFCGVNLPEVYGSNLIAQRAQNLGIPYELHQTSGRGHDVHLNGLTLYPEILPDISAFFNDKMLKPNLASIDGKTKLCKTENTSDYTMNASDAAFQKWIINNGTITSASNDSTNLQIAWNPIAIDHSISVIPYSIHGSMGDTTEVEIELIDQGTNTWIPGSTDWMNPASWSEGYLPMTCEDVIIPSASSATTISIPSNADISVNSIQIGSLINIEINANAIFRINANNNN